MKGRLRKLGVLALAMMLIWTSCMTVGIAEATDAVISNVVDTNVTRAGEISPDKGYIKVSKEFVGITPDQIPPEFLITVTGSTTYTLNAANTVSKSVDGLKWEWSIDDVSVDSYQVSESGEGIENYSVATIGVGSVEIEPGNFTVTSARETTCSHTNWPVKIDGDTNVLFAAALTSGAGCVVISKTELSVGQQETVAKALIGGNWKEPVKFYSLAKHGNGPYTIQGKELHYEPTTQEVILHDTSVWSHVATVEYSITEASTADIAIKNTYTRLTKPVVIRKLITGNMRDTTKKFSFIVNVVDQNGSSWPIETAPEGATLNPDGSISFSLGHDESITIPDVPINGSLTIAEDPDGYEATSTATSTSVAGRFTYTVTNEENQIVTVTNNKDAIPDTGILLDSLPYVLILACVIAIGVFAFIRKRRNRDD